MKSINDIDMDAAARVEKEIELHGSVNEALAHRIAREFHSCEEKLLNCFIIKTTTEDWHGSSVRYTVEIEPARGDRFKSGCKVEVSGFQPKVIFANGIREYDAAVDILMRVKKVDQNFGDDRFNLKYRDMDPDKRARKFARSRVCQMFPEWGFAEVEHYIDLCISEGRTYEELAADE